MTLSNSYELSTRFKIHPCQPADAPYTSEGGKLVKPKEPLSLHWNKDATQDPKKINLWKQKYPNALIGIPGVINNMFWVDIDGPEGEATLHEWEQLDEPMAVDGKGIIQKTPHGWHYGFLLTPGVHIPNNAKKIAPGVDLRSNGYIVTGKGYEPLPGHGFDAPLTEAPVFLLTLIMAYNIRQKMDTRTDGPDVMRVATIPSEITPEYQERGIKYWFNYYTSGAREGERNDRAYYLGLQLHWRGVPRAIAESLATAFCSNIPQPANAPYTQNEFIKTIRSAYNASSRPPAVLPGDQPVQNDHASFEFNLEEHPITSSGFEVLKSEPDRLTIKPTTGRIPEPYTNDRFNDDSDARYLLSLYGEHMHYVRAWGWVIWDGSRWVKKADHLAMQLAKAAGRNLYKEAATQSEDNDSKKLARHANKSLSAYNLKAALTLAASEVNCDANDFDKDPFLFNCHNGILDLRTGKLTPHFQAAMLTKMASTHYDPQATCPKWNAFLLRIMDGKKHMVDFLQRAVGYSLTSSLAEQAMFFLYGGGANGKSTFIKTVLDMMGEYADQAPSNFLTNPGRFDTARLVGTRFCATVEVTEGKNLAEAIVKMMTGGDRIVAEEKNKDPFATDNTFKIWLAANHKPNVRNNDEAIWRRIKLIPFTVTIPEQEQNHNLLDELRDEFPGILNWAVQGCLEWQKNGIQYPDEVRRATAEYRADSDVIGQFINDCCIQGPDASAPLKDIFAAYLVWAEANKERNDITNNSFSRRLEERGLQKKKESAGAKFYGIGLKA